MSQSPVYDEHESLIFVHYYYFADVINTVRRNSRPTKPTKNKPSGSVIWYIRRDERELISRRVKTFKCARQTR